MVASTISPCNASRWVVGDGGMGWVPRTRERVNSQIVVTLSGSTSSSRRCDLVGGCCVFLLLARSAL